MVTCPMKNRHCEGVITVDLSSCVSMGVYGCLWVSWVLIGVWVFMGVYIGVYGSLSLSLSLSLFLLFFKLYCVLLRVVKN